LKFEPVVTGISKSISASIAIEINIELLSNQHDMKSTVDSIHVTALSSEI